MLALTATNVLSAVLFALVYIAGAVPLMSHGAYLGCLLVVFAIVTALWVTTERRHTGHGLVRRVGRGALALLATVVVIPALALLPLAKLESLLPVEAGVDRITAPTMAVVLVALVLTTAVNVVGGLVVVVRRLAGATLDSRGKAP
jgi:hypothetical protein